MHILHYRNSSPSFPAGTIPILGSSSLRAPRLRAARVKVCACGVDAESALAPGRGRTSGALASDLPPCPVQLWPVKIQTVLKSTSDVLDQSGQKMCVCLSWPLNWSFYHLVRKLLKMTCTALGNS